MFLSVTKMPSTTSVLSTYTTIAASAMVVRTVFSELQSLTTQFLPPKLQEMILQKLGHLVGTISSSEMTLIIDEYNGLSINELYHACETYLSTRISPSIAELKLSKAPREKSLSLTINKGQRVVENFEGIQLTWELISCETQKSHCDYESSYQTTESSERRSIRLCFHKRFKEKVLNSYIPSVVHKSKLIKEEQKVVKLHSLGGFGDYTSSPWSSVNLDHPSTFDTIAMDPDLKKELIDDLDRFVNRREFYKRVGKAWKRGYLLYGPPGTGKSSLIAAMANYLKFDIYDMELTSLTSNSELRRLLVGTGNRSILVIEDIDCSIDLENRQDGGYGHSDSKVCSYFIKHYSRAICSNRDSNFKTLTLSGLLNFIDGLWSSCGDERIIVFTTNYKDRIDPALLRPGRMDMHIHMGYCTPSGFRVLANNYLGVSCHNLFHEIDELLAKMEVTPAEIAEEFLKNVDPDVAFRGLIEFLKRKLGNEQEKPEVVEGEMEEKQEIGEAETKVGIKRKARGRAGGSTKVRRAKRKAKF